MPPEILAELLDGLDPILADLAAWQGRATGDSPIEERRQALAAGFAHAAITVSRTDLINAWGDPRG